MGGGGGGGGSPVTGHARPILKKTNKKTKETKGAMVVTLVPNDSPPNLVEILPKLWDDISGE